MGGWEARPNSPAPPIKCPLYRSKIWGCAGWDEMDLQIQAAQISSIHFQTFLGGLVSKIVVARKLFDRPEKKETFLTAAIGRPPKKFSTLHGTPVQPEEVGKGTAHERRTCRTLAGWPATTARSRRGTR